MHLDPHTDDNKQIDDVHGGMCHTLQICNINMNKILSKQLG